MWDRRSGSITRVADTLVISVSQPTEAALWGDGPPSGDCAEGAELRTGNYSSPANGESPPGSGTWLGSDSDCAASLGSEDTPSTPGPAPAASGDGIQIICRFDSPPPRPSPPSSPPPYPPPPPPVESSPTLAALSHDVSEFSSIIEIDGDSFCIRSRLAGQEEPEPEPEPSSSAAGDSELRGDHSDSDSDSDSDDETAVLVAQCRRFYESRLVSRWPALIPEESDEPPAVRGETLMEEEHERPTSVDSGRESGTDSRTADQEDGAPRPELTETQTETQTETRRQEQTQTPLEAKMALLRREVSSLMRQDNELFRQLLSLHDSIEALKHGDGSLSAGSSLCSLADIEEEDTISTPSTDLDRQSHLSTETDNLSLVKGDSGSERSFFSEILHVTGMSQWAKTRLLGPSGLTAAQVAPPSPRQVVLPPHSPAAEKAPLRRHRKQGSCDSGIVDQEIRGQA